MMWSCVYLAARSALKAYERWSRARYPVEHTPIPLASDKPAFSNRDVSILIATINTPDDFAECIRLWLANTPKEIIIVTIPRDVQRVNELLAQATSGKEGGASREPVPISVFTVPRPGVREQMTLAIRKATGKIIALCDDDTYWPSDKVLPYLLAGFEDPRVGAVGGNQSAFVPPERRRPDIVTASEVFSLRAIAGSSRTNADAYAREGVVWCLAGRALLARTQILQTDDFCHAFTHENWAGRLINTGDDSFITHYLMDQGWNLAFQSAPEAEVVTRVEPSGGGLAGQLVRWRRSGFRHFLTLMLYSPGFWAVHAAYPLFARSIARFLLRPMTTAVHTAAWVHAFWTSPRVAGLFFAYELYVSLSSALDFYAKNSWVGLRNIWAIFLMDNLYQLINIYVVFTLHVEGWLTRDDVCQEAKQVEGDDDGDHDETR